MDADSELKIEAAAVTFLLGLFTGASSIEVVELSPRTPDEQRAWRIRLTPPQD